MDEEFEKQLKDVQGQERLSYERRHARLLLTAQLEREKKQQKKWQEDEEGMEQVNKLMEEALFLFEEEKYEKAIGNLEKAKKLAPELKFTKVIASWYGVWGISCFNEQKFDLAIEPLKKSLALDAHTKGYANLHLLLGEVYMLTGDIPSAEKELSKGLSVVSRSDNPYADPGFWNYYIFLMWHCLGHCHLTLGHPEKALLAYAESEKLKLKDIDAARTKVLARSIDCLLELNLSEDERKKIREKRIIYEKKGGHDKEKSQQEYIEALAPAFKKITKKQLSLAAPSVQAYLSKLGLK